MKQKVHEAPINLLRGRQKLAKIILPLIPKHTLYCEPFAGGAAIFFAKEPSEVEVLNDTNGELINFYKVAKSRFKALRKEIHLTLHSRYQHQRATVINAHPYLFNEVQRAWAIWVLAIQSFASKLNGNWGYDRTENKSARQHLNKKLSFTNALTDRLEETQIESADALNVIRSRDSKNSFFFCDPPYFNSHQGHYKGYTVGDFENLLEALSNIKGKFLICSYPSKQLTLFTQKEKWFSKPIKSSLSLSTHPNSTKKMKVEILTANYPI